MKKSVHGQREQSEGSANGEADGRMEELPRRICYRCQQIFLQPTCPLCSELRLAVYRDTDDIGSDGSTWAFQLSLVARPGERGSPMALAVGGFRSLEEATAHANDLVRCAVEELRSLIAAAS